MTEISIVINAFNSSRFILETIDSALKQSFTDFELIIIDDGSKDSTLKVLETLDDIRIQVFPYPNGGIATSRNRGLRHASSEFIAFLDHDDLWCEQKLEQQILALKSNPRAAFAYSWVETIDESSNSIRFHPRTQYSGNIYKNILGKNFIHTASNPLFRREAVLAVGGFDADIYGADDRDLLIRLAEKYEAVLSPHYHVRYRIVKGSGSANVVKLEKGALQVIDKAFRTAPDEYQSIKPVALGRLYQFLCFRALEDMAGRQSGLAAWRYLWLSLHYNHKLWGKAPIAKAAFKISAAIFLPKVLARGLTTWVTQNSRALGRST